MLGPEKWGQHNTILPLLNGQMYVVSSKGEM